jgi:hypothetical protein
VVFTASNAVAQTYDNSELCVRTSTDLIHWSPTSAAGTIPACAASYAPPPSGSDGVYYPYIYPSFIGDTGDPLTGGLHPRVFFQKFQAYGNDPTSQAFPSPWQTYYVGLESIALNVTLHLP